MRRVDIIGTRQFAERWQKLGMEINCHWTIYRTLERETYEECYISKFFLLKNFVDGRRKSPGCLAAVQKCIQLCRENKMPFTFIHVNTMRNAQPNSIWRRIRPLAHTTARIQIKRPEHNINLP